MKLKNIVDSHLCILSRNNFTPAFVLNSKHILLCCHCTQQGVAGSWLALYTCSHSCSREVAAMAERHFSLQFCFGMLGSQECFVFAGELAMVLTYEPHAA